MDINNDLNALATEFQRLAGELRDLSAKGTENQEDDTEYLLGVIHRDLQKQQRDLQDIIRTLAQNRGRTRRT
jgi:hypothetical protein